PLRIHAARRTRDPHLVLDERIPIVTSLKAQSNQATRGRYLTLTVSGLDGRIRPPFEPGGAPRDNEMITSESSQFGDDGKEVHAPAGRRDRPFIKVNCAAVPSELLESELFGHEKGAFTGAYRRKLGQFEYANGGTIFLDEIGELPLALQAKLLHVLQDFQFGR